MRDIELFKKISLDLDNYTKNVGDLPILEDADTRNTFIMQLVDSVRRIKYVTTIANKRISSSIANPYLNGFNPLKAAVYHFRNNNLEEASWLIFLATHFGNSKDSKWLLTQDFYKGINQQQILSWSLVSSNLPSLKLWIEQRSDEVKELRPKRKFGNHRKYESLKPGNRSIYNVFESYVSLILEYGSHNQLFRTALTEAEGCRYASFDNLYKKLSKVISFGRTGKFDYLTMIGKLGLFNIEPSKTYMSGSTGPLKGCRLLFGTNKSAVKFEEDLYKLSRSLSINPFGMQVLEDALCNWQKNQSRYVYFRG
jgi:Alpha-glutamyl/putrescinyl thymine pyrophosphorylase clade 3